MRFLFVDKIIQLSPNEFIRGIKHITREDSYVKADKQGRYYFIPSLIGETLGQLAAWNIMHSNKFTQRPVAGVVHSARMYRSAYVGETLLLESYIDGVDEKAVQYHSEAKIGEELVFSIEGALGPLLPMQDFIDLAEVEHQFAEIYHPDDSSFLEGSSYDKAEILEMQPSLRVAPMLYDRILVSESGVSLRAEKRISKAAVYFPDHFPKKPVVPMTVLLECNLNLAYEFVRRAHYAEEYELSEFRKIKMNEFIIPGDVIHTQIIMKQKNDETLILAFRSEVNGKRVCVVDVVFQVLPRGKLI